MYCPKNFEETRIDVMCELIVAHPFATLITQKDSFPEANHLPILMLRESGRLGLLQGHVARSNNLWQEHPENIETLAIFQGPAAYITPSWYHSKSDIGKVVPTWNYAVVQARGRIKFVHDKLWLLKHLNDLTLRNENKFSEPWQVSDAPEAYIDKLMEAIVGIEIEISELTGKWKVSQNRSESDRLSVAEGLAAHGFIDMADIVRSHTNTDK